MLVRIGSSMDRKNVRSFVAACVIPSDDDTKWMHRATYHYPQPFRNF